MSEQPKCTLRDAELLADVEKWVSKLCDTGGRAWTLSVPVNFNRDPDMLITELCKRYAALLARHNALRKAEKTISECLQDIAFRNGVNSGWNAALLPTDLEACTKKAELLVDPCNRLATLKAARAEVDRLLEEGEV